MIGKEIAASLFQAGIDGKPEYRFFQGRVGVQEEDDIGKNIFQEDRLNLRQVDIFRPGLILFVIL